MESIISSIITGATVFILIGLVWRNLTERVKENKQTKVEKEMCKIIHSEADKKFSALFDKLDKQSDILMDMAGDIKVIKKGLNNG